MKGVLLSVFALLALGAHSTLCAGAGVRGHLETEDLPARLRDRGEGVPSSMFATYIQKGQLLIYPYFEYYRDSDYEYKPSELGYGEARDYRGKYEATEELIFIGYGLTSRLAVELEAALMQAELKRGGEDDSDFPDVIDESGLGDVEAQVRWRWVEETGDRPELFSYFETVFPTQEEGSLIGTTDWEVVLGTGIVRGFSIGTFAARAAFGYEKAESTFEFGEIALEYVRRLSSHWRVYGAVEGTQDEFELITEGQLHFSKFAFLKLNSAVGLTSKAPDWAPEVGVLFSF